MATQFKSYANADISNTSGTPTVIIDNTQITASKYGVLIGLLFTNKSATTRYVVVQLVKNGGDTVQIIPNLSVPPNVGFEALEGNKIVMETGDVLNCYTDAASAVDIVVSVMINDS